MFNKPDVFNKLIKRFDGEKLPSTGILGNILHQVSGVPDSWKDRVAQIFTRNAHFAGIIDSEGFLRYDAAVHTKSESAGIETDRSTAEILEAARKDPLSVPAGMVADHPPVAGAPSLWSYKTIKVQTPESMSKELWEKLNLYVQLLKPSDEGPK